MLWRLLSRVFRILFPFQLKASTIITENNVNITHNKDEKEDANAINITSHEKWPELKHFDVKKSLLLSQDGALSAATELRTQEPSLV
jgi:2,3-bisphosphoglycerate-independent phosphoglycerate mutase